MLVYVIHIKYYRLMVFVSLISLVSYGSVAPYDALASIPTRPFWNIYAGPEIRGCNGSCECIS